MAAVPLTWSSLEIKYGVPPRARMTAAASCRSAGVSADGADPAGGDLSRDGVDDAVVGQQPRVLWLSHGSASGSGSAAGCRSA
jgi:hypothetical protein